MSLFDTIKYPISVPPTSEEFGALPNKLFAQWYDISDWINPVSRPQEQGRESQQNVGRWYCRYYSNFKELRKDDIEDLKLLRRMIAEYEE